MRDVILSSAEKSGDPLSTRLLDLLQQSRLLGEGKLEAYQWSGEGDGRRLRTNKTFVKNFHDSCEAIFEFLGRDITGEKKNPDMATGRCVFRSLLFAVLISTVMTMIDEYSLPCSKEKGHTEKNRLSLYVGVPLGHDEGKIGLTNKTEDKNRERFVQC